MDSASLAIAIVSLVAVVILGGWTAKVAVRTLNQTTVDAKLRRVEAILDTVLEMRDTYSSQFIQHGWPWKPAEHSPEALARISLHRRLEGQLVPFTEALSATRTLNQQTWDYSSLKLAADEVKALLLVTVNGSKPRFECRSSSTEELWTISDPAGVRTVLTQYRSVPRHPAHR